MKSLTFLLAAAALAMAACTGQGTQPEQAEQRVVEDIDESTGVITLRDYNYSDTISVGGRTYRYTCSLQHSDSVAHVINPQGLEYKESRVRVAVERDGNVVFDRTYCKDDFSQYVPAAELPLYTMVGVSYNFNKSDDHSAMYFIVTVGDPDETSDMAYPFEIQVNADGTTLINKAKNLETESMNPGLNIDPSGDEGV